MARKFFGKGLLMLACSAGMLAPAHAAAAAGSPSESASTSTTSTTTTSPSSTTTSSSTTTTAPSTATSGTAAAAPTAAAPAATSTTSTTTSSTASTSTGATSTSTTSTGASTPASPATPAAASQTGAATSTPSTTTTTRKQTGWPAAWSTKKDEPEDKTNYKQTYKNAVHSECVLIAEYVGYQKNPDVRFNQPILAEYKIVKILKGPPLNKHLPIKYEFHDHSNPPTPPGWKFSDKEMPAVNSQWLIFIEHAVPHNGQFETYEGSWGRQPASEDNLNTVYELLHNQGETGY